MPFSDSSMPDPRPKKKLELFLTMILIIPIIALVVGNYVPGDGSSHNNMQSSVATWADVERVVGIKGAGHTGGIFTISLPRDDMAVTIGDVVLDREIGLDSWISFRGMGDMSMMMGDLVLTAPELRIVQRDLQHTGINITAIHTTLIGEAPQVYDLHIEGMGDPIGMAGAIMNATRSAGVSYSSRIAGPAPESWPDKASIDGIIGAEGSIEGRILSYSIPRTNPVTADGMVLPPDWDVATKLKLQPLPDHTAAAAGEFVLTAGEVSPVIRALNDNGITVTALHSHMLIEEPRLFYLHFWAVGDRTKLARGLHDAISQTSSGSYVQGR